MIIKSNAQTGWRTYPWKSQGNLSRNPTHSSSSNSVETCNIQHIRLHQIIGNSTTIGSRTKVGILGDPHPELNSSDFFVQRCFFACQKANSLAIDGGVKRHTCHTQHFHKYSHCTDHTAQTTCVLGSRLSCAPKNRSSIHASCFTLRLTAH